ncbi:GGDEF domain-containing protein [Halomonas cerina]|uniref:diguanylate cyclase n=1 Tax=Halomonas cerina TaxID=447424 RepID=A0A839V1U9_9GAMM|nr:diguanylate cyclase [Halomonas cerina]MBB3189683.1 diguanylate cyclase (GGDEF)-like protein/PAS domain S-box-containing protein [Halomonas cerina]
MWRNRRRARTSDEDSLADRLLAHFPGTVMVVDAHGVILRVGPGVERHTGHPAEQLLGKRFTLLDIDPLRGDLARALRHCVVGGREWQGVLLCRRADGNLTYQDTLIQPLPHGPGDTLQLLVTQHDVTELRRTAQHDHALLERLQRNVARLPGVVFELRREAQGDLDFLFISEGLTAVCGLSPQAVMDSSARLLDLVHIDDREVLITSLIQSAVSLSSWRLEFRLDVAGNTRWIEGRALPRRQRDGNTLWDGMLIDVSRRKQDEQRVQQLVSTDMLTGLLNRRAFFDHGEAICAHAERQGRSVPVAMLDIDHFKALNDTHGHAAGDLALQTFAATCRDCLRPYDLLARIGGEEFVIMLVDSSAEEAWRILERLRASVAATELAVDCTTLRFTVSIGLTFLAPGASLEASLARADLALYQAKHEGRNRIVGPHDIHAPDSSEVSA